MITPKSRKCPTCKKRRALNVINWHLALAGDPMVTQEQDPKHPGRTVKFSIEQTLTLLVKECRHCNPHRMVSVTILLP